MEGHKLWEWRYDKSNNSILHYHEDGLDIYSKSQQDQYINMPNSWSHSASNLENEKLGKPCSTREVSRVTVAVTSTVEVCGPKDLPTCFLDVLLEGDNTWMWDNLLLFGDND